MLRYRNDLKLKARELRKNMTDAERLLWSKIRKKQINNMQWYRQRPIGKYIVDFYCPFFYLILEVDGAQHYEQGGVISDQARDRYFEGLWIRVMRFTNIEVLRNIRGVLLEIEEKTKIPLNLPLKKGEADLL